MTLKASPAREDVGEIVFGVFFRRKNWIPAFAGMTNVTLPILVTPAHAGVQASAGCGAELFFGQ